MQFTTHHAEAVMFKKHLTRLSVTVIIASISVALLAGVASVAFKGKY